VFRHKRFSYMHCVTEFALLIDVERIMLMEILDACHKQQTLLLLCFLCKTISFQTVLISVRVTLYGSCMLYTILFWGLPSKLQNIQFFSIFMFFCRNAFQSHPTVINRAIKFEQEIKTLDISQFKITNFNSSTA